MKLKNHNLCFESHPEFCPTNPPPKKKTKEKKTMPSKTPQIHPFNKWTTSTTTYTATNLSKLTAQFPGSYLVI